MSASVDPISLYRLSLAFLPVLAVLAIQYWWSTDVRTSAYGLLRMLLQLMLIGYVLVFLFESESGLLISFIILVMVTVSSWIALRPLSSKRKSLYGAVFVSIAVSGITTLFLVTTLVLEAEPWFAPRFLIPLGGMIFANAMNTVSLAAERFESEIETGVDRERAKRDAFTAALIPVINSLFAVGLVSLPGMMTGQVLSGVSPLIAARYQIVVMCMIFGSSGIAAAVYLAWRATSLARRSRSR
jgi:putative ABC transport system permease protein